MIEIFVWFIYTIMFVLDDFQTFNLTFRLVENYLVDFYYFMDFLNFMVDDKEKLVSFGVKIGLLLKIMVILLIRLLIFLKYVSIFFL